MFQQTIQYLADLSTPGHAGSDQVVAGYRQLFLGQALMRGKDLVVQTDMLFQFA